MEVNKFVLEDLYKIFTRRLSHFARQLQLKHTANISEEESSGSTRSMISSHCMASSNFSDAGNCSFMRPQLVVLE
jgi:hypothetical protein